jgi:hypothetical protein
MKHLWTIACSRAVTDMDTHNVSLQNIVEELTIRDSPRPDGVLPVEVQVVSLWMRDVLTAPEKGQIRISFRTPKGKSLKKSEGILDLRTKPRARVKAVFLGLPLAESGLYSFRVDARQDEGARWRKSAEVPLIVTFSPRKKKKRTSPRVESR